MLTLQETMTQFYLSISVNHLEKLKNKTILVTGASGLIGGNITACLDLLSQRENLNLKIIAVVRSGVEKWMAKSKRIIYRRQDLSRKKLSHRLRFDYLIHCATYAQPKKFLQYPKETVLLNIKTLFDLLDLCQENNATALYLSSAEIYGEADKAHLPTDETYAGNVNTLSDRAIYAESKRLAETICYLYSKKIPLKIARVLLTYGPGLKYDDRRVISEFIKRAQTDKTITMMDSGGAYRTFCFISDMVEMLLNVLLNGKSMVYNLCGRDTTNIRRLAEMIAGINGARLITNHIDKSISGTPTKSMISNAKYLREFPKTNFTDLKTGLTTTSNWFKLLKK
ncbi:NAD-dependent epimerase/dehydratase family protein [Patescibacteria group bacterium]|nr:NAD-dependent epimerase/dehydratase family protein [Patescibacteria group bacterium]